MKLSILSIRRWLTLFALLDVLDGAMILLAMISLNVLHPGYLLFRRDGKKAQTVAFLGTHELSVMN